MSKYGYGRLHAQRGKEFHGTAVVERSDTGCREVRKHRCKDSRGQSRRGVHEQFCRRRSRYRLQHPRSFLGVRAHERVLLRAALKDGTLPGMELATRAQIARSPMPGVFARMPAMSAPNSSGVV